MEGETNNASQGLAIQELEPIQLSLLRDKSLMSNETRSLVSNLLWYEHVSLLTL